MRLSIVIPSLNEGETLQRCLAPLQPWRADGVEVIVVEGDAAAGDGGDIASLCDRRLLSACGRARQMNAGAAVAEGEWLLFLHADTRLPGDWQCWLQALATTPRLWGFFPVGIDGSAAIYRLVESMMNWRSRVTGVATGDQCQFVRRELFRQVGGFADIALMEDVELSKRLRRRGSALIWRSPVITSCRRWQRRGILRTVVLMWWLRLAWWLGVSPARLHRWYYPAHRSGERVGHG